MIDYTNEVTAAMASAQSVGHVVALHDLLVGKSDAEIAELQEAYVAAMTANDIPLSALFVEAL
jgi:hypothetical protein